jgi:spore coat protein JB
MNNQEQMLKDIGIVGFTVLELAIYLDTHPSDRKAIEYFNHYNRIQKQLEKEFSRMYYPLTLDHAESNQEWSWGAAPLPWEGVCG